MTPLAVRRVTGRGLRGQRRSAYFAHFHPDATFLFHTTDRRLTSTEEYRQEWAQWVAEDGFAVRDCVSDDA